MRDELLRTKIAYDTLKQESEAEIARLNRTLAATKERARVAIKKEVEKFASLKSFIELQDQVKDAISDKLGAKYTRLRRRYENTRMVMNTPYLYTHFTKMRRLKIERMLAAGTLNDIKSAGSGSEEVSDVASEHRVRLESFDTMDDINRIAAGSDSPERELASSAKNASKVGIRLFSPRRQTQPLLTSNLTLASN